MMIAAALAVALSARAPRDRIVHRHLSVAGWDIRLYHDTFTDTVTCTLTTKTMRFHRDLVIFHLGRDVDTSDAYFRIDRAPARRATEAFGLLQAPDSSRDAAG